MIILILDANNSILYTTDCHIQFNCRHFCVDMIFFIEVRNCMDKNFLPTFPWSYSLTFCDFPDHVETLLLLVGGNSKVTKQDLWFFMNTPGNSTSCLGATRNSICSWKNVMTFYFYPYPTFKNFMKIFLSFIYFPRINSFPNATRMFAKQPVSEAALQRCS